MAEQLTTQQARELADRFLHLAVQLADYCVTNSDKLTDTERVEIHSQASTLLHQSSDMTAVAIGTTLEGLTETLNKTSQATDQMQQAIVRLDQPNKILGIAAAAVQLGAAILTFNPVAIVGALRGAQKAAS